MDKKNRAKEYYKNNRDIILNRAKEKIKDYQREYRKNMTDEE